MSLNQGNNPENSGEKKDPRKPFKFNIYWLYALIAAVLIGFNLFRGIAPDALPTSQVVFEDSMLLKGYVKNYLVVKNKGVVKVTLKPEAFSDPVISTMVTNSKLKVDKEKGPHFQFSVSDAKTFDERTNKLINEQRELTGRPIARYDDEENWFPKGKPNELYEDINPILHQLANVYSIGIADYILAKGFIKNGYFLRFSVIILAFQ